MSEFELQALSAIREHMIAMVMLIDQLVNVPRGSEPEVSDCAAGHHPVDGRIDASSMSGTRYHCGTCHELVEMGDA